MLQLDQTLRLTDQLVEALLERAQLQLQARDTPAKSVHLGLGPRRRLRRGRELGGIDLGGRSAADRVHVVEHGDGLRPEGRQVAAEAAQYAFGLRRREKAGEPLQPVHGPARPMQHGLYLEVERIEQARVHGADKRFAGGGDRGVRAGASGLTHV